MGADGKGGQMNDTVQGVPTLPARAAMLLAVEVLLADPEALGNDALEGDLYILRDQLRAAEALSRSACLQPPAPARPAPAIMAAHGAYRCPDDS
jgi:hypothetical protein